MGLISYDSLLVFHKNFGDDVFASLASIVVIMLCFCLIDEEPSISKQIIKKSPFKNSSSVFLSKYFSVLCAISLFAHFVIALYLSPFVDFIALIASIIVGGIISKIYGRITINRWNMIYEDGMKRKDLLAELNVFSFFFLLCFPIAILFGLVGAVKYSITSLYVDKKSILGAQGFNDED